MESFVKISDIVALSKDIVADLKEILEKNNVSWVSEIKDPVEKAKAEKIKEFSEKVSSLYDKAVHK